MKALYQKNTVKATPLQLTPQQQHARADRQSLSFADNRPQAHQQAATQQMANISQRGNEITQLQVMAEGERPNRTGLPDSLKAGIENLSGYSMDDVKVHYNSDRPAQLQAHAYAQGTDIHLAPGQEKHLPHEAWHVAQQKQGRVQPTLQMKGVADVNDDEGLEREADVMGATALQFDHSQPDIFAHVQSNREENLSANTAQGNEGIVQCIIYYNKRGRWSSKEKLIAEIAAFFNADEDQLAIIREDVEVDSDGKGEWDADLYYKDYKIHGVNKYGWAPPYNQKESNDHHGPQLPVDGDIKRPSISVEHSSENTFTWPSKTMGRAQVIYNGKVVFDVVKYSDNGLHAENQMIASINGFVNSRGYSWDQLKIRITINNFPCDEPGAHCGKLIASWAKEKKMREIHIYYANKYEGKSQGFEISWDAMKSCNIPINLSPFKAEEYISTTEFQIRASEKLKPIVPSGRDADPFSDSEEESDHDANAMQMEEQPLRDILHESVLSEASRIGVDEFYSIGFADGTDNNCSIISIFAAANVPISSSDAAEYRAGLGIAPGGDIDLTPQIALAILNLVSNVTGTNYSLYVISEDVRENELAPAEHNVQLRASNGGGTPLFIFFAGRHFSPAWHN